jgi:hypothetical protein
MRRLLPVLFLFAAHAHADIALVNHTSAQNTSGGNTVTGGINTTGASLIVAVASTLTGGAGVALTDSTPACPSPCNTWTSTTTVSGQYATIRIFYVLNPTVGPAHSFLLTGSATALSVAAFSGVGAFGASNANTANSATGVTSIQSGVGGLTPGVNGSLVVFGMANDGAFSGITLTGGGAAVLDTFGGTSATLGNSLGYVIQTNAANANPTWSWTGAFDPVTELIYFTPSGAVSVARYPKRRILQ